MCGGCCALWVGVANAPPVGPRSATSRLSGVGNGCAGRNLKKSPAGAAHHSICGREWFERATAPRSYLGSPRRDPGIAVLVQLEVPFGYGRNYHLELLLPAVSGEHQSSAGNRIF